MKDTAKPFLPPLIKTKSEVIERRAVGIKTFPVGSEYNDKLRREVQHLPELHFLCLKLLFRLLAIFNVDTGSVPSCYVPPLIFKRISADQKAAIRTVVPQQPRFDLMGRPAEKFFIFFDEIPFTIIWMNKINSRWGEQLIGIDTEILDRYAIGVDWVSIRPKHKDLLWHEDKNLPDLHFLCLKLLFRLLALFYIEINSSPIQQSSVAGMGLFGATEEPAVHSISVRNPLTELTGAAGAQTGGPDSP